MASFASYQDAMRQGHALAWDLKWEAASHQYSRALTERPDDAAATVSLAIALVKLGELDTALEHYTKARRLLPDDLNVLLELTDLQQRLGHPDLPNSVADLATLYLHQGQADSAAEQLRRLSELPSASVVRLQALQDAAERRGASEILTMIATQLPDLPRQTHAAPAAPASVATVTASPLGPRRSVAQAVDPVSFLLETLATIDGQVPPSPAAVTLLRRAAGDWCLVPEDLLTLNPALRPAVAQATFACASDVRAGRREAAIDAGLDVIAIAATFLPAQVYLTELAGGPGTDTDSTLGAIVDLYESRGHQRGAAAVGERLLRRHPDDRVLRERIIQWLLADGINVEAAAHLRRAAEGAIAGGSVGPARRFLERAVDASPNDPDLLLPLGRLLAQVGDDVAAETVLSAAAQLVFSTGPRDRARDVFRSLVDLGGTASAVGCRWLSHLASTEGDRPGARAWLRRSGDFLQRAGALESNLWVDVFGTMAALADQDSDLTEQILARTALLQRQPGDIALRKRLAECYYLEGNLSATLEQLNVLAGLSDAAEQLAEALVIDQAAAALAPTNAALQARLGERYVAIGLIEDGSQCLEEALSLLQTSSVDRATAVATRLVELTHRSAPRRALQYRIRLACLNPLNVPIRRELVNAYLQVGRASDALEEYRTLAEDLVSAGCWSDAVPVLRDARRLAPWDAGLALALADSLAHTGADEEATVLLRRLIERQPGDPAMTAKLVEISRKNPAP